MKTPEKAHGRRRITSIACAPCTRLAGTGPSRHQYAWKRDEADKNILRTHTTAVSARCLHKLAQDGFRPAKYFSIDRVFRNEAVDRTHLAEFHQVEGVICDKNLTLGDLIGVLHQFFARLGMTQLRFKPAFNPYTEPSMEIFAYHPMLKKWVEVGNSGMFRPEMMLPMGMPEDVNVIGVGSVARTPDYDHVRHRQHPRSLRPEDADQRGEEQPDLQARDDRTGGDGEGDGPPDSGLRATRRSGSGRCSAEVNQKRGRGGSATVAV